MTEYQVFDSEASAIRQVREQRARADQLEASLREVRAERDHERELAKNAEAALGAAIELHDAVRLELEREKELVSFLMSFTSVDTISAILDGKAQHFAGVVFVHPDTGEKWDLVLQKHEGQTPIEYARELKAALDAAQAARAPEGLVLLELPSLGVVLRRLRELHKKSMGKVADALGVSVARVSDWELGCVLMAQDEARRFVLAVVDAEAPR